MTADYLFVKYEDAGVFHVPWRDRDAGRLGLRYPTYERPVFRGSHSDVYRDDLRGGWHVVPSGVRYVAVKGIVAGQRAASFCDTPVADIETDAADLNSGAVKASHWNWERFTRAEPDWSALIDLHDLADHRPRVDTQPLNPGPRYAFKAALDMVNGETWLMWSATAERIDAEDAARRTPQAWPPKWRWSASIHVLVDLADDWHRTHSSPPTPAPAPVGPALPSDAEIVALHTWIVRGPEAGGEMPDGWLYEAGAPDWRDRVYSLRGHSVTRADREEAWSRVLAARVDASAERERMRVEVDWHPLDDMGGE